MQRTNYTPPLDPEKQEQRVRDDHDDMGIMEEVMYQGDMYVSHEQVIEVPQVEEPPFYAPDFIAHVNLSSINSDHTTCQICGDDLTGKRFYNHLFDHHGFTKQQCDALKQQKRMESFNQRTNRGGRKAPKTHSCETCGLEFVTRTGLTSHLSKAMTCAIRNESVDGKSAVNNIACPSFACPKNVATYLDLAIHVDTEHRDLSNANDSFRIRRVTFPDKHSFMKWKTTMEHTSGSEFFLRTTQKVVFAIRTYLYKCVYSNSRGQGTGRRCEQCPAFIKACERNHGQFEVVACFGHLGHEHPTETPYARQLREEKYREYEQYQQESHDQRMRNGQKPGLLDAYGQPGTSNRIMILMPPDVEEEEEEYAQVIVDDADDEIMGQRVQQPVQQVRVNQVYLQPQPHRPGPSSHY